MLHEEYLLSFDGCRLFVMQRYSGSDLHGVTAKVIDMPHHCMCYSFTYIVLFSARFCVVFCIVYNMAMYLVSGLHPHSVCIFRYNIGHLNCLFPQKSAYEALSCVFFFFFSQLLNTIHRIFSTTWILIIND